jgi:hypothetical protein
VWQLPQISPEKVLWEISDKGLTTKNATRGMYWRFKVFPKRYGQTVGRGFFGAEGH